MAIKFSLFHSRISVPALTFYSPPRSPANPLLSYALCFSTLPYGPSLRKGHSLQLKNGPCSTDNSITSLDEAAFTRVFDISALRVPSEICSTLENRLRGHLLNWPRINNIARVPGDEIDDQITGILPQSEAEAVVTLNRRIYGQAEGDGEPLNAVLYRDKLATTFNSQGYSRFRNLAKISRPKKKKRRDGGEKRQTKGVGRNEVALVEVVEDDDDGEDMSGLLGEDFGPRAKWRGSTRLLLFDEQYTNKRIEDLPEAIKVVFREHDGQWTKSAFELVKCKLTLFYDYWQLNEVLEALLPKGMIVPSAFETVGHIAHLNLRDEHLQYKNLIAKVVLDKNKPKIQTVVNKIVAIHNDYRTMQLEVLAGNNSLVTTVVENGLRFHVDLAKVYWNSRLATERQRLLSCFTHSDVVCDVFAGVGPIAIFAAKKVKYVYANDLNPCAVEYLEKNCVLNKLERKIEVFNMDGRRFIQSVFASQKTKPITQVVMNLPKDVVEFLDALRGVFHGVHLDKDCTLPRIHVYGFSKAEDPEFDFHERIRIALAQVGFDVEMHKVRLVAPGKWMLCASFVLPEKVAFFRPVSQFSTRRSVMLMPILFSTQSIATKSAAAFDFRMTVPDQSLQEAESAIQSHVQSLLKVKDLLMSESWKEAQKLLRKSSSLLKQDIYTIIQNKSAGERPRLRKLYSDLFNGVTRLDYAARDKDRVRVWECYDGIVSSLQDILSRI